MRRPLFGTGIPLNVPGSASPVAVDIFDTTDKTQANEDTTYLVTLFAWWWTSTTRPNLSVILTTDGETSPPIIASYSAAYLTALEAALSPEVGIPLKIVDRLMMRGDQQLSVKNGPSAGNDVCFIYGYYEAVGETPTPFPYRPLQPAALEDPFSGAPTVVFPTGPNATQYKTAHQLDSKYIDLLTLHVNYGITADDFSSTAFVELPGGVKFPLPQPAVGVFANMTPFDNIPMRPAVASDNLVEVGFDDSGDTASGSALVAYGNFYRY